MLRDLSQPYMFYKLLKTFIETISGFSKPLFLESNVSRPISSGQLEASFFVWSTAVPAGQIYARRSSFLYV